jgi:hypothetical protein
LFQQLREWDLWQMSRSYVDVYFPRRAIAETELGLLPFHLPPSTSHHIKDKDRGASSSCTRSPSHAGTEPDAPSCSRIAAADTHWDVASPSNATFHARYHPLDEIESFVRDLAAAYPQQVAIVPLGHSGEGREMFALEISSAAAAAGASGVSHDQKSQVVLDGKGGANPRCGFLVTGAQHAREVSYIFALVVLEFLKKRSGLPLLPHCTSHTPSWLTRLRSFLSPVYLSVMYVPRLWQEGQGLIRNPEFLHSPRPEPRWIRIYMGKRPILVRPYHRLRLSFIIFGSTLSQVQKSPATWSWSSLYRR